MFRLGKASESLIQLKTRGSSVAALTILNSDNEIKEAIDGL